MEANSLGRNTLSRWREKLKNVCPTQDKNVCPTGGMARDRSLADAELVFLPGQLAAFF
jgi:hypothetical protein